MGAVTSAYLVPLLVVAVVLFAHGLYFWRRRALLPARAMSAASIAAAIWVSGYGFELVAEALDDKIFWCRVQYFGKVGLPVAWFVVAAQYCGYDRRLNSLPTRAALVTIPLLTLIFIWTNDQHHLYQTSFELEGPKQSRVLVYQCGAWCGVHLLYCYTLTIAGAAMLVISARQSDRLRRYQAILLLLTAIMPLLASVMDDVGVRFIPYLKLTPVSFAAALAAGFVGIVFLRMFEVVPIAWSTVFDNMNDAVFVVDFQDRIVDCNRAAHQLLESQGLHVGQYADSIVTSSSEDWNVLRLALTGDWRGKDEVNEYETEFSVYKCEQADQSDLATGFR
jgi:PAS domain-containing protein